ncbi:MAG: class I SAM-dependent methyltransferase [Candidatus Roizmanbacteria bacterium]|nr:class I SAM-dependent methyltransferase [Candidatus Roizmanbacteria bacterium]
MSQPLDIDSQSAAEPSQQKPFAEHPEWFNAFLDHFNGKQLGVEVTPQHIQEKFPDLWSNITDPSKPIEVLFIGAGNGIYEVPLVAQLAQLRGASGGISVYCMDPSEKLHGQFMQNAESQHVAGSVKDYVETTFEDPSYRPPKADLAVASHCWYYVPEGEGTSPETNPLAKFAQAIKPGGAGLIALQSETSDNFKFRSEFTPKVHGGTVKEKSGEDIERQLEHLGIAHEGVYVIAETDMSPIFPQGTFDPTDEGKKILSFMVREEWDKLSPEMQAEIKDRLTDTVSKNVAETGKNVMYFRERYIWIPGHANEESS